MKILEIVKELIGNSSYKTLNEVTNLVIEQIKSIPVEDETKREEEICKVKLAQCLIIEETEYLRKCSSRVSIGNLLHGIEVTLIECEKKSKEELSDPEVLRWCDEELTKNDKGLQANYLRLLEKLKRDSTAFIKRAKKSEVLDGKQGEYTDTMMSVIGFEVVKEAYRRIINRDKKTIDSNDDLIIIEGRRRARTPMEVKKEYIENGWKIRKNGNIISIYTKNGKPIYEKDKPLKEKRKGYLTSTTQKGLYIMTRQGLKLIDSNYEAPNHEVTDEMIAKDDKDRNQLFRDRDKRIEDAARESAEGLRKSDVDNSDKEKYNKKRKKGKSRRPDDDN